MTVPPIFAKLSEGDLQSVIDGHAVSVMDMDKFPCHTQSVERCVKLVTEAASAVCGPEARHGFIRCKLQARALMPKFESKLDYHTQTASELLFDNLSN